MLRMETLYFPADAVIGRAAIYLQSSSASALADKVIYTKIDVFEHDKIQFIRLMSILSTKMMMTMMTMRSIVGC